MKRVTRLLITLRLDEGDNIGEVVRDLPEYCSSSFRRIDGGLWSGEFIVTCPEAPELAEGDFVDDLSPHFPALIRLKGIYEASYSLEIAVGSPASKSFFLHGHSVALLAALGASITVYDNSEAGT
ncbi:MAG: hypothetical protein V4710_00410 [Verrucomicrobiota bacterium]